jgi:hypothetical protein
MAAFFDLFISSRFIIQSSFPFCVRRVKNVIAKEEGVKKAEFLDLSTYS